MSLFRRTAHCLAPHARLSLIATAPRPGRSPAGSASCAPRRRGLHIGAFAGEVIQSTADAFSWVHASAGMPWYLAIPLLAVGVNVTLRFPVQLYVAKLRARRGELNPLVVAWARRHTNTIAREQSHLPERILKLRMAGSIEKSRRRIYRDWGVQRWKGFAPLLGILPFVTISEALRRKCGAPLGWISQSVGLSNPQSAGSNLGPASGMFDPSLVDGGCLWFMDLTSADPYYGLPVICTSILVWNTWGRMSKDYIRALLSLQADETQVVTLTRLQKVLGRVMLMMPIFPLLFADLPSAIFLYWVASFGLSGVNEAVLNRLVPKEDQKLTGEQKRPSSLPYLKDRRRSS
ncbi:hypothetical protein AK830_g7404 [Neonectria ditissima]|uniref:Mitochondrial inner membrane protein COX18 n=1 Tax=Neonectria ditissima TaxID=78410 RepID=A0A0N8H6J5_9HYPO|nr:hypothetical protein AK830_g7404 [Neonectria ditissima]